MAAGERLSDPLTAPGVHLDADHLMALRTLALSGRPPGIAAGRPGDLTARRRGRGHEVLDIRRYQPGDEPRHLDRNVTARTGHPHIRTFHDERERAVMLVADFRAPMLWGTRRALRSVAAAEALVLVAWRAAAAGGRVGCVCLGADDRGRAQLAGGERAMGLIAGALSAAHGEALAAARAALACDPLDGLIDRVAAECPHSAEVWIATALDYPGDDLSRALRHLSASRRTDVLLVDDGFAAHAPPGHYPVRTAGGRLSVLRISRQRRDAPGTIPALTDAGVRVRRIDASRPTEAMLPVLEARHG